MRCRSRPDAPGRPGRLPALIGQAIGQNIGSTSKPRRCRIAASPATDCGLSCPRSCGGEEGSNRPSQYSCLRGWAPTPTSSQPGGDLRHLATHAATAASFNPQSIQSNFIPLYCFAGAASSVGSVVGVAGLGFDVSKDRIAIDEA